MLAAYTKLKNAQKIKQSLSKQQALSSDYLPVKEFDYIYFPVSRKVIVPGAKIVNTKFTFPQKKKTLTIDEVLKVQLTKQELKLLPRSQEIIGDIMILEIPKQLKDKEKLIAEAYLQVNKLIRTVVKKHESHSGIYRTRKVKILAGSKDKETVHHENGIQIKLHLDKTYFSARSANERLRIANQVKEGEEVLVMFSGVAPFPLVIAKNSSAKMIYGIEINPVAHQYAVSNVALNNLEDKIIILLGDVRQVMPKINQKFDRIVMPLPMTGEQFLDIAVAKSKKGTIIHLYAFLNDDETNEYAQKVKKICSDLKHPVRILGKVKCGQFSPRIFRECFDLEVCK